jgi:hypothetical protein
MQFAIMPFVEEEDFYSSSHHIDSFIYSQFNNHLNNQCQLIIYIYN